MRGQSGCTYRYEKMTSIKKTNLARTVGRNGETNAGKKKTTEIVALVYFVSLLSYGIGLWL